MNTSRSTIAASRKIQGGACGVQRALEQPFDAEATSGNRPPPHAADHQVHARMPGIREGGGGVRFPLFVFIFFLRFFLFFLISFFCFCLFFLFLFAPFSFFV